MSFFEGTDGKEDVCRQNKGINLSRFICCFASFGLTRANNEHYNSNNMCCICNIALIGDIADTADGVYCKYRMPGDLGMEQNQRVTVTKRMLREGLLRLLDTKPLDKVNITELCHEAGINRTTFYRYYKFPKDILLEMQSEFFEEGLGHFQHALTADDVERFFLSLSEHTRLVKLFFQYNSDADWIRVFSQICQSFPKKNMSKAFQNLDETGAKLLSAYLAGGAYFLARQWIMEDIPVSAKDVSKIALNVLNQDKLF